MCLQTASNWRKPAFGGNWSQSERSKTILERCYCVGRAAPAWVAQPRWVAQEQTHRVKPPLFGSRSPVGSRRLKLGRAGQEPLPRPSKTWNRPSNLQKRFGSKWNWFMNFFWPSYTSQISSQSDFISNQTSNPHYKCFCNFHFGFFKYKFCFGFSEVDTDDFIVFLQGYGCLS